ncbi:MAG: hypothetical protein M3367_06830 [Acidobacteriota bacterium]|nr:hypothetical protein [Acidobacteriota bacterium]
MVFLLAAAALAQALPNPSDTSNVIIVQKKWRLEVRNPALDEDPLRAHNEQRQAEYDRREYMRKNDLRIRQGKSPEIAPPPRRNTSERAVSNILARYIYELKIKNNGEKKIRAILWEYVFFEPNTEIIVGQRQFINKVSISPGKTKNIVVYSASPPTETINATKAGEKSREQYSEQIIIQSIEYEDGSVWKATSK